MADLHEFLRRAETFGYDRGPRHWWAHAALRLLLSAPRVYAPLLDAWDRRFPGTVAALDALSDMGVRRLPEGGGDRHAQRGHGRPTWPAGRYLATAAGRRLAAAAAEDARAVGDRFPQTSPANLDGVARLLAGFDLDGSHARFGRSVVSAAADSGLSAGTARMPRLAWDVGR